MGRDMDQALAMEAGFLEKWMTYHQNAVRSLSKLSSVADKDFKRMAVDFSGFVNSNANFLSLVYVDSKGMSVFSADREGPGITNISVADRPYFQEAQKGRESVADLIIGRITGKPVLIYSVPLKGEKGFEGLIFGSIPFGALLSALASTPFRSTGNFYLYQENSAYDEGPFGVPPEKRGELRDNGGKRYFLKTRTNTGLQGRCQ